MPSNAKEREYFILSVHHCSREKSFIELFRPNDSGYAFRLHSAGRYTEQQVMERPDYYNDGDCNIAVPCDVIESLLPKQPDGTLTNEGTMPAQPVIPEQNDLSEKLIGLANHIASAANGIPSGWQDWADEIVTDLRSLASTAQPVIPEQRQMVPDERPADSSNGNDAEAWFDEGWNACRAEMLKAQPVSEPYKLAKSPEACAWISDGEGLWLGDCGVTWQFFDDGPDENGLKYCPSCGKKVSIIAAPAQESE